MGAGVFKMFARLRAYCSRSAAHARPDGITLPKAEAMWQGPRRSLEAAGHDPCFRAAPAMLPATWWIGLIDIRTYDLATRP
jgi:hypothetical protein